MSTRRGHPFIVCLALLAGCEPRPGAGDAGAADGGAVVAALGPSLVATHEWSVQQPGAPFVVAMLGAQPPAYADALMGSLPTALFKATTACAKVGAAGTELFVRVDMAAGADPEVKTSPQTPFASCVAAELARAPLPPSAAAGTAFEVSLAQSTPKPLMR